MRTDDVDTAGTRLKEIDVPCIGWDVLDGLGSPVESVPPARKNVVSRRVPWDSSLPPYERWGSPEI